MKAKTIQAIIAKKVKDWADTIEDERVRDLVRANTIVTGGCIASMLLKEPVNDFDVYFRDYATTYAVAQYYLGKFTPKTRSGIPCAIYLADGLNNILEEQPSPCGKQDAADPRSRIKIVIKSAGIASEQGTEKPYEYFEARADGEATQYVSDIMDTGDAAQTHEIYEETEAQAQKATDTGYRPVFMSTNAITLTNRIQIVIRFWGLPEDIHENYDFVHCTNYWTSWDCKLTLQQPALEALLAKELRYVGSRYPLCSLIRLRKFIQRGWTVNAGQILKIAMQLQGFDLSDPAVLEDQLTGVDQAYFTEVIAKLKDRDSEKISTAYLIEIIDRMF